MTAKTMKTNGVGRACDWLNRDVSMADHPEFFASSSGAGLPRADGYVPPRSPDPITWRGKPVSDENAYLLWGTR